MKKRAIETRSWGFDPWAFPGVANFSKYNGLGLGLGSGVVGGKGAGGCNITTRGPFAGVFHRVWNDAEY